MGGQGLRRDYPEVRGGQQVEQFPLVTVHGGGLQLLHHLRGKEREGHRRLWALRACWESPRGNPAPWASDPRALPATTTAPGGTGPSATPGLTLPGKSHQRSETLSSL